MKAIRRWFSGLFGKKPSNYTGKVLVGAHVFRLCEAVGGFIPTTNIPLVSSPSRMGGYLIRLYTDGTTSNDDEWTPYEEPASIETEH